jgi:hypothetical protein
MRKSIKIFDKNFLMNEDLIVFFLTRNSPIWHRNNFGALYVSFNQSQKIICLFEDRLPVLRVDCRKVMILKGCTKVENIEGFRLYYILTYIIL